MIVVTDRSGAGLGAEFPYQFYAKKRTSDADTEVVNLVMPFGGKESGFFRYPREGETILVDQDAAGAYYLMGHLPSESDIHNNFLINEVNAGAFGKEKQDLKDEAGMILRYQQTGKKEQKSTDPSDRYSEIGFYHRPTQWKTSEEVYTDKTADIPKIDQLNIQSTGDIHTKAKNHHRMKAKRIEILSNVEESDFSENLTGKNRPYGDKGADISQLLQGDIHLRGKRRILLKAGSEIRLEVGRSTIVISDAGIVLSSRKTHSDIHNTLDTVLSVLPRDGITMFGQHLKLAAAYDWSIAENMGSSIKGTAGIMRLLGKDIRASTISGVAYITNFVSQTAALAANLTSMSMGTHDEDNIQSVKLPSYVGMGVGLAGTLINVLIGLKYPDSGKLDDPDSKIVKYIVLALQMMSTVITAIETIYISPEDKKGKDALALAGVVAEWGCLLPVFIAICAASVGPFMVFNDSVHWGNNGELTLLGAEIKTFAIDEAIVNSPLAGGVDFLSPLDRKSWYEKLWDFVNDHRIGFVLGTVGVIGGGVGLGFGAAATLDRMSALGSEKERLLAELNAL
jgi:hypothetical protein